MRASICLQRSFDIWKWAFEFLSTFTSHAPIKSSNKNFFMWRYDYVQALLNYTLHCHTRSPARLCTCAFAARSLATELSVGCDLYSSHSIYEIFFRLTKLVTCDFFATNFCSAIFEASTDRSGSGGAFKAQRFQMIATLWLIAIQRRALHTAHMLLMHTLSLTTLI